LITLAPLPYACVGRSSHSTWDFELERSGLTRDCSVTIPPDLVGAAWAPSCALRLLLGQRHSFRSTATSRSPQFPPLRVRQMAATTRLSVSSPLSSRVNTPTASPRLCVFSGPPDGLRSLTPYAPGVGASDQPSTPPPSPRSSRAGLVLHMAQAISTTQTTRLPHAVSTHSTSFRSSHQPRPLERA